MKTKTTTTAMYPNMSRYDKAVLRQNLWDAAIDGDLEKLIRCIHQGFPIQSKYRDGEDVFITASAYGHLPIVQYLIMEGHCNVHTSFNYHATNALHYASANGYLDVVQYLVKECSMNVNEQDDCGKTALHFAIYFSRVDVVEYLIYDCQADITLTTSSDENVFDLAYKSKYGTDIVVMLLTRLIRPQQQPPLPLPLPPPTKTTNETENM
jgi:hypothetical protein